MYLYNVGGEEGGKLLIGQTPYDGIRLLFFVRYTREHLPLHPQSGEFFLSI
jgi:hypothetical protein